MSFKNRRDKAIYRYSPDSPDESEIQIPDGIVRISCKSFYNCTNLKIVYLPPSVYTIDERAFEGCTNLSEIYAPGVTHVSPSAFEGCINLRVADLPFADNRSIILKRIKENSSSCKTKLYSADTEYNKPYIPGDIVLLRPHTFSKQIIIPREEDFDGTILPKKLFARLAIISGVHDSHLYSIKVLLNQGCTTRNGVRSCFFENKLSSINTEDTNIWFIDDNIENIISNILSKHEELLEDNIMKITIYTVNLISDIEELIASHCYNPNSYDGFNGLEGAAFRYPLTYPDGEIECKTKNNIRDQLINKSNKKQQDIVNGMKYIFGSNRLYIGEAIIDILNMLERRYKISFEDLEKQKNDKRRNV